MRIIMKQTRYLVKKETGKKTVNFMGFDDYEGIKAYAESNKGGAYSIYELVNLSEFFTCTSTPPSPARAASKP
jgi:hypothetical protein